MGLFGGNKGVNLAKLKDLIQAQYKGITFKTKITVKKNATVYNKVLCEDEKYRLGIWVRDSVQGLGTITYLTTENEFAALGHGIHDSDTNDLLDMKYGKIYQTRILRIMLN